MSKFGELIDTRVPVLLNFYSETDKVCQEMSPILREVATTLGDTGRVIKIDVDKNKELAEALRVRDIPTFIIYKNGEMKWRQSGEQDSRTLVDLVNEYL
ncbi:thioredoxin [Aequorivita sp. H23M31]|uniref:Thioredoxin n=1 Tax=Aequorivita ciconiae TaxID=2494375 RepID=A0A410G5H8_9FLAO|nr:thioredoxin family protein [Aequorivita sp. H23M31]QAA82554.1 thioredoxin [Aequorivita sp. H23M31]